MKRVVLPLAVVLAVLGALAIRVVVEGRQALADGRYETAARWYLPFAPHVDEAYAKLRTLTKSEDPAVALAAWRSIRAAARATRSLWQPHADDLAEADAQIAKLSAVAPGGGKLDGGEPLAWHEERLARDVRPSLAAAILAGLGIALWVAGAFVLARRGTFAVGPTGVIVLGLAVWFVGLYKT
jgi:hypothetical protein